jgi:signal transduction histidine kinase
MKTQNKNPSHNSDQSQPQIKTLKSLAASIAHETRNPLSAIQGACEIIRRNLDEAMEFLDLIDISSSRGLVISDIILQNIQDGEIDKSKFVKLSMAAVLDQAVAGYAFSSAGEIDLVNVKLAGDFDFFGDENLMIFVVFNLLKNALYCRAKINIWMDCQTRTLHFKDDGIGIAADQLEFIFDDFFTSNKKGGTGLGLPFCKRVMNSFGGDISCKSAVGKGAEFCLRF